MTAGSTPSVVRTSSQLLKFFVASVSKCFGSMPSTVKRIPLDSLDVSLLSSVTLGTFALGGAGVDSTHVGVGFFFGAIVTGKICLQSLVRLWCWKPTSHNSRRRGANVALPPITPTIPGRSYSQLASQ